MRRQRAPWPVVWPPPKRGHRYPSAFGAPLFPPGHTPRLLAVPVIIGDPPRGRFLYGRSL